MKLLLPTRRVARSLVVLLSFAFFQNIAFSDSFSLTQFPSAPRATAGTGACAATVGDSSASAVEVVTLTNYCVLKFKTGTNSWTAPAGVNNIWLLVIGGGGSGGFGRGGGGGAGGMYENTAYSVTNSSYSITIGNGGVGTTTTTNAGGQSIFGSLTINGGGAGGSHTDPTPYAYTGAGITTITGASGGGSGMNYEAGVYTSGGGSSSVTAVANVSANGGANSGSTGNGTRNTGGGGGAGGAGVSGSGGDYKGGYNGSLTAVGTRPNGGAAKTSSITGTSTYYAGGGGGAVGIATNEWGGTSYQSASFGTGGNGIGGDGQYPTSASTYVAATNGTANTGSGGGGGGAGASGAYAGGAGGSGVVIIRWIPVAQLSGPSNLSIADSHTATLTYSETTSSTLTITRQWQFSTDNGSTWNSVSGGSGATTLSYTLPTQKLSFSGYRYRGSTTYSDGTISSTGYSSPTTVTIFTPPGSDTDTALTLNGSTQYASVADDNTFDITGAITMEAWVKPTSNPANGSCGMVAQKSGAYELMMCNSGGTTTWQYGLWGSSAWLGINTSIPVSLNEWHHIAFTRAASTNSVLFYLDGINVYTGTADTAGSSTINNSTYPFAVGVRYTSGATSGDTFTGTIDQVAVFNIVRTGSDIQSDMNSYINTSTSGIIAYYDFNEGSGSSLYNRVIGATNASDLTVQGSPVWSDVKVVDTTTLSAYTIVKFPRTYITNVGGWRVPANVSKVTALVVAGGGAGGSRVGGGGGAGGYVYRGVVSLVANTIESITVGQGGVGIKDYAGKNGFNSSLGTKMVAIGGGGGGASNNNGERAGKSGGSGGGTGDTSGYGATNQTTAPGSSDGLGNNGAVGEGGGNWSAGGGGGARAPGFSGTHGTYPGFGGTGAIETITGVATCYAAGGGGGIYGTTDTLRNNGGGCSGFSATGGSGKYGSFTGTNGSANTGSGGGGAGYGAAYDVAGGNGGSGIIVLRWITALVPAFTYPTNQYLDVGQVESFSVNMQADSATAILNRTFRWESSTTGAAGTFTKIQQGTGINNTYFAWYPQDTRTSGSNYVYRVIVTDSDTAGLFIVDTSTPVYATINPAMIYSGNRSISKTVNIGKSETFTITLGTGPYQISWTGLEPTLRIDTITASSLVIKVSDTATIGTYYETLTVIDSVSAVLTIPLTVKVAPVPTFLNSASMINTQLVLDYEPGNSQSLLGVDGQVTTGLILKDLSGRKNDASTDISPGGGWANNTSCGAPKYSSKNGGAITISSNKCYYTPFTGAELRNSYTVELWLNLSSTLSVNNYILGQLQNGSTSASNIIVGSMGQDDYIDIGFMDSDYHTPRVSGCGVLSGAVGTGISPGADGLLNKWIQITGTYDGSTFSLYLNGALKCTRSYTSSFSLTSSSYGINIGTGPNGYGYSGFSGSSFSGSLSSIRMYAKPLSSTEIALNYNATKDRFDSSNNYLVNITKKYGSSAQESFTVTTGTDSNIVSYAIGNRSGIIWDTATSTSIIKLSLQESSTIGTYYETLTVVDANGSSTYLPLKMNVIQADTLTVTVDTATVTTYNGSPLVSYPRVGIKGLVWSDTATVQTAFSSPTYTQSTSIPINADTYTVQGTNLNFTIGSSGNYVAVVYETSTAVINKAKQSPLNIFMYGGTVGSPFLIILQGGSGDGAVTETLTGVSNISGCAINNHFLTSTTSVQGFCEVRVTKAESQNYLLESSTVQLYFMAYVNNAQSGQVGSGPSIGINEVTPLTIETGTAPSITGPGAGTYMAGSSITLTGSGFSSGPITIKFWRNKFGTGTVINSNTSLTTNIPLDASSGVVILTNAYGTAISTFSLTITPFVVG